MSVQAVTSMVSSHGLVILDSEKGKRVGQEQTYTVRTRTHRGGYKQNLSFGDAMRHIQNIFEESKGKLHFASIEFEEPKTPKQGE